MKQKYVPRYYQEEAIDHAIAATDTPILCAPTGSGKRLIALWIAKWFIDKAKRVAILTPREELLNDFVRDAAIIVGEFDTGVVKSGWEQSPYRSLQICSWPTLRSRAAYAYEKGRDIDMVMPSVDVCLIDECHLSVSRQMRALVLPFFQEQCKIIGLTATPATRYGRGLGSIYQSIKHVTSVQRLVKEGYLCPLEYFGGRLTDLRNVDVKGDYVAKQLGANLKPLIGDYVDNWLRLASNRHTLVFTPDKASCEGVTERYQQAGIAALALHSGKHPERRAKIVEAFKRRDAQVLVNVGIASYGFDCPTVDCLQLLRDTKSLVLHLQQLGRGMRAFEGKTECMVLDHTRNVRDLGYGDELYRWKLHPGKDAAVNWSRDPRNPDLTLRGQDPEPHVCQNCNYMFSRRLDCPSCGTEYVPYRRDLETTDAKLVRISRRRSGAAQTELFLPTGQALFQQLLHIQERRGYKPKWARTQFRKMDPTKGWPPQVWDTLEAKPPTSELLNHVNRELSRFYHKQKAATG